MEEQGTDKKSSLENQETQAPSTYPPPHYTPYNYYPPPFANAHYTEPLAPQHYPPTLDSFTHWPNPYRFQWPPVEAHHGWYGPPPLPSPYPCHCPPPPCMMPHFPFCSHHSYRPPCCHQAYQYHHHHHHQPHGLHFSHYSTEGSSLQGAATTWPVHPAAFEQDVEHGVEMNLMASSAAAVEVPSAPAYPPPAPYPPPPYPPPAYPPQTLPGGSQGPQAPPLGALVDLADFIQQHFAAAQNVLKAQVDRNSASTSSAQLDGTGASPSTGADDQAPLEHSTPLNTAEEIPTNSSVQQPDGQTLYPPPSPFYPPHQYGSPWGGPPAPLPLPTQPVNTPIPSHSGSDISGTQHPYGYPLYPPPSPFPQPHYYGSSWAGPHLPFWPGQPPYASWQYQYPPYSSQPQPQPQPQPAHPAPPPELYPNAKYPYTQYFKDLIQRFHAEAQHTNTTDATPGDEEGEEEEAVEHLTWEKGNILEGLEDDEDDEDEEPQYAMTDEWVDFFGKSEARRREKRRQAKKQAKAARKAARAMEADSADPSDANAEDDDIVKNLESVTLNAEDKTDEAVVASTAPSTVVEPVAQDPLEAAIANHMKDLLGT